MIDLTRLSGEKLSACQQPTEAQSRYDREDIDVDTYHFSEETPERLLIRKDVSAYVHDLILQLPLHYRTVLTLFYLDEFSIPEIQAITGMPEGTVKNYLFRAKQLLKLNWKFI